MARKTGKLFVKEEQAAALPMCVGAMLSCRNQGQAGVKQSSMLGEDLAQILTAFFSELSMA